MAENGVEVSNASFSDVHRAIIQAFLGSREFNQEQMKNALASILTTSNKLEADGESDHAADVSPSQISVDQINEFISLANEGLFELDYEIRASRELGELVWRLENVGY
ncbi:hypothetical protein V1514DRAFT_327618 [Lipomyces japonicus]|uniref:uncharacterized protein n=1 Tax=Lipomyces japonicus TaxID=56871 RepID=UPI0034CDC5CB